MIQISPGDLIAIAYQSNYYYALILDKIRLFGGNWVYVFHLKTEEPISAEDILSQKRPGFHAYVDFIRAKRDNRIIRLQRKIDVDLYPGPGYLKSAFTHQRKADQWYIYDMEFQIVKRVKRLRRKEKKYPNFARIDDSIMAKMVDENWLPEKDVRI